MVSKSKMKIILSGCGGKMGKAVMESVKNFEDCEIVGGIDPSAKTCEFPVFRTPNKINIECDVIIDFSHPDATLSILNFCESEKVPCVICTTGHSIFQVNKIKEYSKFIPIFMSSNMSIGVYWLQELAKIVTAKLGKDFDVEIVEKHHNRKIDAPSGTALTIAEAISQTFEKVHSMKANLVYDRHVHRAPRKKNEIGIHSIRGGSISGDHEVIFAGNGEVLTISHHAESREIFAVGAIRAALFLHELKDSKPGLYSVKDMFEV